LSRGLDAEPCCCPPREGCLPVVPICRGPLLLISTPNQWLPYHRPGPIRGAFRDRHKRWAGMRWTASCARGDRRAGDEPVSDHQAGGREMLQRTAKSCGPDAPTLASSSRSCVGPTGLRQNISADDGGKGARSPGSAKEPVKTIACGNAGCFRCTRCYSCAFYHYHCTRDRGCIGHPAFPTPSQGREI
jgi:hypothetical protein